MRENCSEHSLCLIFRKKVLSGLDGGFQIAEGGKQKLGEILESH